MRQSPVACASSGSNRILPFVFDSDGDTDPDTNACGNDSRVWQLATGIWELKKKPGTAS